MNVTGLGEKTNKQEFSKLNKDQAPFEVHSNNDDIINLTSCSNKHTITMTITTTTSSCCCNPDPGPDPDP